MNIQQLDPHSYYRLGQPRIQHIRWNARVDTTARILECIADIQFDGSGPVDLDTRDLSITSIADEHGTQINFEIGPRDPILGSALSFTVPDVSHRVIVRYETSSQSTGLYWLEPEQTAGGHHPFLFSNGWYHHARSFLPCQDTPRIRFSYDATLMVPKDLRGVCAARHVSTRIVGDIAIEQWSMPYAIPAYLFAFVVGRLERRELSHRSCVWAEPELVEATAWEFQGVEDILQSIERLFGPYPWGRFDLMILSPFFPFGGMENPTLPFLSGILLSGDRSQIHTVVHELVHAWTGNLVTNASLSDFWLNEGCTTYAEWRGIEDLYGVDERLLQQAISGQSLEREFKRFADRPHLTALHPNVDGQDPDDVFSSVPYVKGALFMQLVETHMGRDAFDSMIRKYMNSYAFGSITTEEFRAFVEHESPGTLNAIHADAWLNEPGLPNNAPIIDSPKIQHLKDLSTSRMIPQTEEAQRWSATEWSLYLQLVPRPVCHEFCGSLIAQFQLDKALNIPMRWAFLVLAAESGHEKTLPAIETFLGSVGTVKLVRTLYGAMIEHPELRKMALAMFQKFRGRYHAITRSGVEQLFVKAGLL